jgi:hypothetical protein
MNAIADFTIIGRVGEIKEVGTTVRVSVASSYSGRDSRGDWADHTRWNEVTIFNEKAQGTSNVISARATSFSRPERSARPAGKRTAGPSTVSRLRLGRSSGCARGRTALALARPSGRTAVPRRTRTFLSERFVWTEPNGSVQTAQGPRRRKPCRSRSLLQSPCPS